MGTLSGIGYPLAHLLLFLSFFLAESRDFLSDQHRGNNAYLTRDEHWFNQTLDHFSPTDHRKFGQRFYEFLDYYQVSKGPIFLKICGESACNGIVNDYTSSLYRPVRTGPAADWYADRPLPGGTAKIGRWRSILAVGGRLREKSIVGSRLRKKKGRERRGKEERRRRGEEVPRPRTLAARGRLFSLREETEHLPRVERDRGD
ncbi:hypothetical protein BHM03_00007652, partial [Ensete ventricosum]